jgi:hypothetical protein
MLGEVEDHGSGALIVAAPIGRLCRACPHADVGTQPVVLKQGQAQEHILQGRFLREPVGFADEAAQAVTQDPVDPLEMDGVVLDALGQAQLIVGVGIAQLGVRGGDRPPPVRPLDHRFVRLAG